MNANSSLLAFAVDGEPQLDAERIALLGKLRGGALLPQLLQTFRDQSTQQIAQIEAASAANDLETIRRIAHTMKSASFSVGANKLGELCGRIENAVRAGEPLDTANACGLLSRLHQLVLTEMSALPR